MQVNFYENVSDEKLKFAVIVSEYHEKQIWCRHRERDTYEIPGGHREIGESISDTAKRELYEETGAVDYKLYPVCVYAVESNDEQTFGMLFYADVNKLEEELHSEIECIRLFDDIPDKLTYPLIQPFLNQKVSEWKRKGGFINDNNRNAEDTVL